METRAMYETMMDTNRGFGIEIECFVPQTANLEAAMADQGIAFRNESYNHTTRRWWKGVSDSSIQAEAGYMGVEVVSPVLRGTDGLRQVAAVCKALAAVGAKVNKSCGLHVHHDATGYATRNFNNLKALYGAFEPYIDAMMPESRRGDNNCYCRSVRTASVNWDSRYLKLNLTAYARHGTVEFRQHSGTVEADKIVAWVHVTQAMVVRALNGKMYRNDPKRHMYMLRVIGIGAYQYEDATRKNWCNAIHAFYRARIRQLGGVWVGSPRDEQRVRAA